MGRLPLQKNNGDIGGEGPVTCGRVEIESEGCSEGANQCGAKEGNGVVARKSFYRIHLRTFTTKLL
jgi:hypothetical protein